jgi:hypothetical protein
LSITGTVEDIISGIKRLTGWEDMDLTKTRDEYRRIIREMMSRDLTKDLFESHRDIYDTKRGYILDIASAYFDTENLTSEDLENILREDD